MAEMGLQVSLHAGYSLEDGEGEVPADDGGDLKGSFEVLLQAIHAGRDDPLDGIGDLDLGGFPGQEIPVIPFPNRAILQEGMGKFFQEEGIAGSPIEDELAEVGGHLSFDKEGFH